MHKVRYGRAEAAIWGMEHLKRAKKKEAVIIQSGKDAVKEACGKTASALVPDEDNSIRRWKREVIYGKASAR